jgi:hypothetical protein
MTDDDADKLRYIETYRVAFVLKGGSNGCLRIVAESISGPGARGA